ncbi:MAG: class I SAM-dependent methyltransferase [Bacteroidota bacterium]|nr:class I SAM-dependent methyltransferase [Bacteroidota bacterium]
MYSSFQLGLRYLRYYLTASNGKGHGVHSPFVFSFITEVLNDDRNFYAFSDIEIQRESLLHDGNSILVDDYGAGSRVAKPNLRRIKDIAASSLKPKKFSQLLFRIVDHFAPDTILELGTSLGISTAYMASARISSKVITMEGAPAIAGKARDLFTRLGLQNITLVEGNFDHTLQPTLSEAGKVDLVFIDGNHRYEPTLRYYREILPYLDEYAILIFDDIHWSREMEQAWDEIKKDPAVTLSIDLFFIGLVFFRKELTIKQHFTIRF